MDYSFYNPGVLSQPFPLYGISTSDQTRRTPLQGDHFHDASFSELNNNYHDDLGPSFPLDPAAAAAAAAATTTTTSAAPFFPPGHSPASFSQSASGSDNANSSYYKSSTQPTSDLNDDSFPDRRSSSEEKEMIVPTQSKRKEQNRAAQRAFRERKERRVRDLEDRIAGLQQASVTLQTDNERLQHELARFRTENEILRITSKIHDSPSPHGHPHHKNTTNGSSRHYESEEQPPLPGPMEYTPKDFFSEVTPECGPNPPHRITVDEETGEKLLSSSATWDFIQSHELFSRGLVDVADVCGRLKGFAVCNGQGPAFREGLLERAVQESVASGAGRGNDELI